MRLKLFILTFCFINLLITPTLLTVHGEDDISYFINLAEEENSEKNSVSFSEYISEEDSITLGDLKCYYSESFSNYTLLYDSISQKVISPPPDFTIEYQ